eukprot:12437047-Alexandrium_andersonii.AAC.1
MPRTRQVAHRHDLPALGNRQVVEVDERAQVHPRLAGKPPAGPGVPLVGASHDRVMAPRRGSHGVARHAR